MTVRDPQPVSATLPDNAGWEDDNYQRFFEHNPLPMWIYDLSSLAFLAVNAAALERYGYSRAEFLKMTIADIRPPEDVPDLLGNVARVTQGFDHAGVWRHRRKDGTLIHVEITSHTLNFRGRQAELVLAYDITGRIQVEQELRHRLSFEATLAEISARFVAPTDLDRVIDDTLARIGRLSGASRAYLFQFHEDQLTMDNTHEWCAAGVSAQITGLQNMSMEHFLWSIVRLRRGETLSIADVSALPKAAEAERLSLESQEVKSLILVPVQVGVRVQGFIGFDNVTAAEPWTETDLNLLRVMAGLVGTALQAQRARQALRSQRENLLSFMRSAVGFVVYRIAVLPKAPFEGRLEFVSPSIREVLGVDSEDPFSTWFRRIHPQDLPQVAEANRRAALEGVAFDETMRIYHPDREEWRWIRAVSNPLRDEAGKPTHFNGLMMDVTDSIQAGQALTEERDFVAAIMDTIASLVIVLDREGRIVRFNRACERITGYTFEEVQGRRVWDFLLPPEQRPAVEKIFNQLYKSHHPNYFENEWLAKDGTRHLIAWSNTAILDSRDEFEYGIGTGMDITEQRQAELTLRKLSSAVEQSASGVLIIDRRGDIEYANPRYAEITGFATEALVGKPARFLGRPDAAGLQADIWPVLLKGEDWRGQVQDCKPDGHSYWVLISISPIVDSQKNLSHFVAVVEDVTPLQEAHEEMRRLASYDALTGLPNRRLFRDRLQQALKTARRRQQTLALLYLDLDNFKRINDSLGHDAGDRLLQTVAERLQDCVREEDTVARLGGDEFVMLLSTVNSSTGAQVVARKILTVLQPPMYLAGQEVVVTASIGITLMPDDSEDPAVLMRNADLAMYRAKETGRNHYEFFRTELNQEASRRLSLEAELRQALEKDELVLYFQPLVRVHDLKIIGFEALARWQHPQRGLLLPHQFIPLAEENGLIIPLGQYIQRLAARQILALRGKKNDHYLYVAVNLSAQEFNSDLADRITDLLNDTGLPADGLVLEITESMLIEDVGRASMLLERLRKIGVRVSVDDFGTGYSSLSYLKRLPVDNLKVDRSFVCDIPRDKGDMEITAAIIAMAHKLDLSVVAEGVESLEQLEFLRKNHCDLAQGFLFGRPVAVERLS